MTTRLTWTDETDVQWSIVRVTQLPTWKDSFSFLLLLFGVWSRDLPFGCWCTTTSDTA